MAKKKKHIRFKSVIFLFLLGYLIFIFGSYIYKLPVKNIYIKGNDILTDADNTDIISFTGSVDEINYNAEGDDLVIARTTGTVTDSVRVKNYFITSEENRIDTVVLNNETISISEVATMNIEGTGEITGTPFKDNITGSDEADIINGLASNDTLTGGLNGDTFVFEGTFGDDTITDYLVAVQKGEAKLNDIDFSLLEN